MAMPSIVTRLNKIIQHPVFLGKILMIIVLSSDFLPDMGDSGIYFIAVAVLLVLWLGVFSKDIRQWQLPKRKLHWTVSVIVQFITLGMTTLYTFWRREDTLYWVFFDINLLATVFYVINILCPSSDCGVLMFFAKNAVETAVRVKPSDHWVIPVTLSIAIMLITINEYSSTLRAVHHLAAGPPYWINIPKNCERKLDLWLRDPTVLGLISVAMVMVGSYKTSIEYFVVPFRFLTHLLHVILISRRNFFRERRFLRREFHWFLRVVIQSFLLCVTAAYTHWRLDESLEFAVFDFSLFVVVFCTIHLVTPATDSGLIGFFGETATATIVRLESHQWWVMLLSLGGILVVLIVNELLLYLRLNENEESIAEPPQLVVIVNDEAPNAAANEGGNDHTEDAEGENDQAAGGGNNHTEDAESIEENQPHPPLVMYHGDGVQVQNQAAQDDQPTPDGAHEGGNGDHTEDAESGGGNRDMDLGTVE